MANAKALERKSAKDGVNAGKRRRVEQKQGSAEWVAVVLQEGVVALGSAARFLAGEIRKAEETLDTHSLERHAKALGTVLTAVRLAAKGAGAARSANPEGGSGEGVAGLLAQFGGLGGGPERGSVVQSDGTKPLDR